MAKLLIFSVYDSQVKSFMMPFMTTHAGHATRSFEEACNDPKTAMCKYPGDFTLYQVGSFDDQSGEVISEEKPVHLGIAASFKQQLSPGAEVLSPSFSRSQMSGDRAPVNGAH